MPLRSLTLTSALALMAVPAAAEMNFNRIASFPVARNIAEGADSTAETSAEIIDVTDDGMTLVYTDSPLGALGRIDIADPANPKPLGNVTLDGEPTSVAMIGTTAFVGVNTSESYVAPSGALHAIDVASGEELASCDLSGQPDSVAKAPDASFIAVAIENERDEDLDEGALPQMPAGNVALIPLNDAALDCGGMILADLTGLAEIAPEDPEPEFVDINENGETVVTLQENNHIVVLARDGSVISHFSAGTVDLDGIDATDERGALIFTESQQGRKREPDAVKWIDADHFATANEGDYEGGSRGWTVFARDGSVTYDSGADFEHAIVQIGHYPDKRSDAKGVEPESVTTGTFDGTKMVFIGAERASIVGVYDATDPAEPVLKQLLPSGVGPEGYVTIPSRNLLISANETDLGADGGARAHVMIYEYGEGPAAYPQITSEGMTKLTGWGALSGLYAVSPGELYAVSDSFYGYQPRIFRIDASAKPARIVEAIDVTRAGMPAQKLDLEGITSDGDGGFWLASEGRTDRLVPHALIHVNAKGEIQDEIGLPSELAGVEKRFGFEGIAMIDGTLWMAVQREWGDDPKGQVKLLSYNPDSEEWGAIRYPLDEAGAGWVGLSEITAHGDHVYIVERDNLLGEAAQTKKIYRVAISDLKPGALGGDLPMVVKEEVRDLLPDLTSTGGYVLDKVEGFGITPAGEGFVVTDNDGVDDSSGETMFFSIGKI
ncbi:esterase-like activity of phytase family protein [Sulfitobacter sp. LCG007]